MVKTIVARVRVIARVRKLLLALIVSTTLITLLLVIVYSTRDRVTQENYQKIGNGMSRTDVESILGKPTAPDRARDPRATGPYGTERDYEGRSCIITVIYNDDDNVVNRWITTDRPEEDFVDRILHTVGLGK